MSKELEALETLKAITKFDGGKYHTLGDKKEIKIIENALKRLEEIDNTKPSEALKCLERVDELQYIDHWESREKEIEIIEQTLIKAQEQEKENEVLKGQVKYLTEVGTEYQKVLEIIKKKDVNFEVFGAFETYKDYEIYYNNKFHLIENKLTKEEFELLKRYFENE